MEQGLELWLGALPTDRDLGPDEVARRTLAPLRALGLDPGLLTSRLVLTPACGLAGASAAGAVRALRTLRTAAGVILEQLAD